MTDFSGGSDADFVTCAYKAILEREADKPGLEHYCANLSRGVSRSDIIRHLLDSDEFWSKSLAKRFTQTALPNLIETFPHRYRTVLHVNGTEKVVLHLETPEDWEWIEEQIIRHGYYDTVGVWSLTQNPDSRVVADQVNMVGGTSVFEIGCAAGQVLQHLKADDWHVEGVDISHLALAVASKDISPHLHYGDILKLPIKRTYDVVLGMDIFEHLVAHRIEQYILRCANLLSPGGALITNIPVLGFDPIFGEVFKLHLKPWLESAGLFHDVEVDERGWPHSGHITLARSDWWQRKFELNGFRRDIQREELLQKQFADYFGRAPARKTTFIFRRDNEEERREQISNDQDAWARTAGQNADP